MNTKTVDIITTEINHPVLGLGRWPIGTRARVTIDELKRIADVGYDIAPTPHTGLPLPAQPAQPNEINAATKTPPAHPASAPTPTTKKTDAQ